MLSDKRKKNEWHDDSDESSSEPLAVYNNLSTISSHKRPLSFVAVVIVLIKELNSLEWMF